jgi:hypothetical protein
LVLRSDCSAAALLTAWLRFGRCDGFDTLIISNLVLLSNDKIGENINPLLSNYLDSLIVVFFKLKNTFFAQNTPGFVVLYSIGFVMATGPRPGLFRLD